MPRSDINETEESPFAYVELSHVIARNGMPRLRLNGVMGLPIATISTGNNDLPGALPHKCYLSSCWVSSPFLYQSASAAFASPSELFFPSHLPPIGFKLLKPRSPSHPHLFHSPPLLIPQLPHPLHLPPPRSDSSQSHPLLPALLSKPGAQYSTHPRTHSIKSHSHVGSWSENKMSRHPYDARCAI